MSVAYFAAGCHGTQDGPVGGRLLQLIVIIDLVPRGVAANLHVLNRHTASETFFLLLLTTGGRSIVGREGSLLRGELREEVWLLLLLLLLLLPFIYHLYNE